MITLRVKILSLARKKKNGKRNELVEAAYGIPEGKCGDEAA